MPESGLNGETKQAENPGEGTSTQEQSKHTHNSNELNEVEALRILVKEAQEEKERLAAALESQKEKTVALLQVNEVLLTKTDQLEAKVSGYRKNNIQSERNNFKDEDNRDIMEKEIEELKNKNIILEYQMKDLKELVSKLRDDIEKKFNSTAMMITPPGTLEMMPSSSSHTTIDNNAQEQEHFELTLCESYDRKYLKRAISKNNVQASLAETDEGTIKCYNVEWCVNNIEMLFNTCLKIELYKIPMINIPKSLNISKDTDIISQTGTKLNFFEDQKITIRGDSRVKIRNFEIINMNYGDTHLFVLENSAYLQFNQGLIKCNRGNKSIFHLNPNTKLELNAVEMENNKVPNGSASCITASRQKEIKITNCKFYNHTSNDFPHSVKLIESNGDLNIMLSEFENNNVDNIDIPCISSHGQGIINIENSRFEKCCHLAFENVTGLYIENSSFSANGNGIQNGGALYISNSKNISIEDSILKENVSCQYGGAIYLKSSNDITFANCVLEENLCKEGGRGGAISFEDSPCNMVNCTFGKNKSTYGGAIEICSCIIKTAKCIFDGNNAVKSGGAVYSNNKDNFVSDSAIVLQNNTADIGNDIYC